MPEATASVDSFSHCLLLYCYWTGLHIQANFGCFCAQYSVEIALSLFLNNYLLTIFFVLNIAGSIETIKSKTEGLCRVFM